MLLPLLLIFLFFVIIDLLSRFRFCKNINIQVILLILTHRFFYTFMYFGWMFNNKIILILYILMLISINAYWYLNKNICDLTQLENDICKYEKYKNFDYLYMLFEPNTADNSMKSLLALFFLISILKILN